MVENSEKGEPIRAHTIVEEHLKAIDQKIEDLNHLRDQLNSSIAAAMAKTMITAAAD